MGRGARTPRDRRLGSPLPIGRLSLPTGSSYDDLLRLVSRPARTDAGPGPFAVPLLDHRQGPGRPVRDLHRLHHSVVGRRLRTAECCTGDWPARRAPHPHNRRSRCPVRPEPHEPTPLLHKITDSMKTVVSSRRGQPDLDGDAPQGRLRGPSAAIPRAACRSSPHAPTSQPLKQGRSFATLSLPGRRCTRSATCSGHAQRCGRHHRRRRCARLPRRDGRPVPAPARRDDPVSLRADGDTVGRHPGHRPVPPAWASRKPLWHNASSRSSRSVQIAKKDVGAWSSDTAMTYGARAARAGHPRGPDSVDQLTPPACNLVISNVPVSRGRYLNGAELLGIYPISALAASIRLNVTSARITTTWTSGSSRQHGVDQRRCRPSPTTGRPTGAEGRRPSALADAPANQHQRGERLGCSICGQCPPRRWRGGRR